MSETVFFRILPLWLKAFGLTLLLEVPVFVWLGRKYLARCDRQPSTLRLALAGAVGTCITHPLLWFVWPMVVRDYALFVVTGELLVAVIESITFYLAARPIRFHHAALVAFVANGVSLSIGWVLHLLGVFA